LSTPPSNHTARPIPYTPHRYHILSAPLRPHFARGGAGLRPAAAHELHPRLAVVAVEREQGVLLLLPLAGRNAAYDAYLHNLVTGFSQQAGHARGPAIALWDAKARVAPATVRGASCMR